MHCARPARLAAPGVTPIEAERLRGPRAATVRPALASADRLHVPEHFHVEVLSALRGRLLRGELHAERAQLAIDRLGLLRVQRHRLLSVRQEIWSLREHLNVYDAAYLAVARHLDCAVVTLDGGLAAAARGEGRLARGL